MFWTVSEVVVDAENLLLVHEPGQLVVQLERGGEVGAEGFLDDDALPLARRLHALEQVRAAELLHHRAELAGGNGEVEQQVVPQLRHTERRELLLEPRVGSGVGQVALAVGDVRGELRPNRLVHLLAAAELLHARLQFIAPRRVVLLAPREADDAHRAGQRLLREQVIERGDELADGEVAARAEDDDGAGSHGLAPVVEPARHEFVELV